MEWTCTFLNDITALVAGVFNFLFHNLRCDFSCLGVHLVDGELRTDYIHANQTIAGDLRSPVAQAHSHGLVGFLETLRAGKSGNVMNLDQHQRTSSPAAYQHQCCAVEGKNATDFVVRIVVLTAITPHRFEVTTMTEKKRIEKSTNNIIAERH